MVCLGSVAGQEASGSARPLYWYHIPNVIIPTLGKLMPSSKVDCLVMQCDVTRGKATRRLYQILISIHKSQIAIPILTASASTVISTMQFSMKNCS